jgi:hypothetical protein
MTKPRVLVLSFPDFMDILSVQRVFWGKKEQKSPFLECQFLEVVKTKWDP